MASILPSWRSGSSQLDLRTGRPVHSISHARGCVPPPPGVGGTGTGDAQTSTINIWAPPDAARIKATSCSPASSPTSHHTVAVIPLGQKRTPACFPCGWGHSGTRGAPILDTHQQSCPSRQTDKVSEARARGLFPRQWGLGPRQPDFIQCCFHLSTHNTEAQDPPPPEFCTMG